MQEWTLPSVSADCGRFPTAASANQTAVIDCSAVKRASVRRCGVWTSLTAKQASNSLTALGFYKSGRLYNPRQCSETVQSLLPCWWTLLQFHVQLRVFYFNACLRWFGACLCTESWSYRTAGITREQRDDSWEREEEVSSSNIPLAVLGCKECNCCAQFRFMELQQQVNLCIRETRCCSFKSETLQ